MIELQDVTKYYGKTKAIAGLTLAIEKPGIYCLLGKNGAGKTTLLRLMAGHINASAGSVTVNGSAVNALHMPGQVSFVPGNAAHFNMPLRKLYATAAALNDGFDCALALALAAKFELNLEKRYNQLSFGMKVMANTILGLASNRDILLLDEPVLGLDAVMRKTFYGLLQESCQKKPKIVLISTHLIDEIATVAETLLIIHKGRLLLQAHMDEIDEKAYSITGPAPLVQQAAAGLRTIGETTAGGFVSKYIFDTRIAPAEGYTVAPLGLQDFFISLVGAQAQEETA